MLRAGVGRVKLMPLPCSDVCGVVCVRHDVWCVLAKRRHMCCLVAPEMSELQRCPGDAALVSVWLYVSTYKTLRKVLVTEHPRLGRV